MILLTGASGYLGRHVLAILEARGLPYMATSRSGEVGTSCDLTDSVAAYALLERVHPSTIIHCAAIVPKRLEEYNSRSDVFANLAMIEAWLDFSTCPVVFASSLVAALPESSRYARGKALAEGMIEGCAGVSLRLPGLFGLPRRNGRMYRYAVDGTDYGVEPAMHVADAAEYLVRAATMPSDGNSAPFNVTYDDTRLHGIYGTLGVTFQQRVQQFADELKLEQGNA